MGLVYEPIGWISLSLARAKDYIFSNKSLVAPQAGQTHSSGSCSKGIPSGTPPSGSPISGS